MSSINSKLRTLKNVIQEKVFVSSEDHATLSVSGDDQKWLFDFRNILLVPEYADLVSELFWEKFENEYPFQVGGVETAAIPIITAVVIKSVQKKMPVNGFFLRKSRKKIGLQKIIEGDLNEHKIILVDDLINTGDTFARQIEILERVGKNIDKIFTLLNFREMEVYTFARRRDVEIVSLFSLPDLGEPYLTFNNRQAAENIFHTAWEKELPNPNLFHIVPKSTPSLDIKRLYMGSDNSHFYAINQADGEIAWKYKVGWRDRGKSIFSSPALYNDTVYFGAYDGNVYALHTETGRKKWVFREADWVGSSPAIARPLNSVFIGLEFSLHKKHGGIVSLDVETGKKKWEYRMPDLTHSSPAYLKSKNVVSIGSNDGKVYIFNAESGKLLWSLQTGGEIKASFAYDEKRGNVLFGSFDGNLYVVNLKLGEVEQTFKTKDAIYSTPLVYKDDVYFTSLDKHLYSLNLKTGELNWKFETGSRIFSSPQMIEEKVVVGSNNGRMYEIDPQTGREVGFFQTTERITNNIAYNQKTKRFFVTTQAQQIHSIYKKELSK